MRCVILALTPAQGERWLTAMENRGEEWQCQVFTEAEAAYRALCQGYHEVCLLCPCPESEALAVIDNLIERNVVGLLTESHTLRRYSEELDQRRREISGEL